MYVLHRLTGWNGLLDLRMDPVNLRLHLRCSTHLHALGPVTFAPRLIRLSAYRVGAGSPGPDHL